MTAPARPPVTGLSLSRALIVVSAVLFVLAAFAAGGHELASISAWPWAFGAFAAWALAWAVP